MAEGAEGDSLVSASAKALRPSLREALKLPSLQPFTQLGS